MLNILFVFIVRLYLSYLYGVHFLCLRTCKALGVYRTVAAFQQMRLWLCPEVAQVHHVLIIEMLKLLRRRRIESDLEVVKFLAV